MATVELTVVQQEPKGKRESYPLGPLGTFVLASDNAENTLGLTITNNNKQACVYFANLDESMMSMYYCIENALNTMPHCFLSLDLKGHKYDLTECVTNKSKHTINGKWGKHDI